MAKVCRSSPLLVEPHCRHAAAENQIKKIKSNQTWAHSHYKKRTTPHRCLLSRCLLEHNQTQSQSHTTEHDSSPLLVEPHCQHAAAEGQVTDDAVAAGVDN
jgi:predicted metal-binding protein